MKRPKRALILCAGYGSRMEPLSLLTPKSLMPFWGRPLLDHTLDLLCRWGVRDVLINLHHAPRALLQFCARRGSSRPRISLSFEPDILGTGGALHRASWFFDGQPTWIVNGDVAMALSPDALLRAYEKKKADAVLWMHASAGPRTVEMQDGRITCFRSRHPGTEGTYTFCGVQLVSARILRKLPASGFLTLVDIYEAAQARGDTVQGLSMPACFWADLGTPAAYRQAHADALHAYRKGLPGKHLVGSACERRMRILRRQGAIVKGFAAVGDAVTASPGCRIVDSVVWTGAKLSRSADLRDAIVADRTRVEGRLRGIAVQARDIADTPLQEALESLGWNPQKTAVMPLPPRGSNRHFTRLRSGRHKAVVIRYDLTRPENALYTRHARFLDQMGIRVARVLHDQPAERLSIWEDLGDESLQTRCESQGLTPSVLRLYRDVLHITAKLHREGRRAATRARLPLNESFGAGLYRWERDLFAAHFLNAQAGLPKSLIRESLSELSALARQLDRQPQVLLHRDLQSSNVLIVRGEPVLIDFQGMRLGPAVYDLGSLLCDPYVSLGETVQRQLLACYADGSGEDTDALWPVFCRGAVQRLVQALGAYGRLGARPATSHFRRHIKPAVAMLGRILSHLDKLEHLRKLVNELEVRL